MHLKATLLKWLKLFFGDTRQAIVSYIVGGLILAGGSVVTFAKTVRDWLTQTLDTPLPIWGAIVLVLLCCLYTYVKAARILSRLNQKHQTYKSPPQYSVHHPIPEVSVYVLEPNTDWYCRHCADVEGIQSAIQMVHHSAAGKTYQCHKCKFGFRIPEP